jgi:predicted nucleotidyltransferase
VTAGPETPPRFYDLLRALCERGADFVIIGGFAVTLHGYVRATKDIDIVPDPSTENMSRLWDALAALEARPVELGDFNPEEMPLGFTRHNVVEGGGNRAIYTLLGRVDLMQHVEDAYGAIRYDELRRAAERVDLEEVGYPIWIAATDHLIAMKEHAGRDIDRIDVTGMRMAQGLEDD